MLEYGFMQRALVAAVLIGAVCGVLGFFVVLRRLAFIGVGISHSAIGGVAVGILAGLNPLATGALFAVGVALGISAVQRRSPLSEDAVIGVFFSAAMALGIVLFSLKRGYQQDLFGYLFGSVLAISANELLVLALVAAAILAVLASVFRPLLFASFDEEVARAYGHRVDALNTVLLVLLAAAVIIGVRVVGVLLIQALLVIPAATAVLWTQNFRRQLALSALLGVACGTLGLFVSWQLDIAAGGSIVLVSVGFFFASLALRRAAPAA
ncbi:MAG: metal ABC transporter permease [Myxococcota bacterium]